MQAVRSAWLSVLCVSVVPLAVAQTSASCQGPAEIESAIARHASPEAYNALGAWFAQRGRTACAVPAFQSAIRLRPQAWDSHFNLALAWMDERRFGEAIAELRTANKLNPRSAPIHTALGSALFEKGDPAGAEAELKTAIEINPRSVPALDRLAQVLAAGKRYSKM